MVLGLGLKNVKLNFTSPHLVTPFFEWKDAVLRNWGLPHLKERTRILPIQPRKCEMPLNQHVD
jgi:hypothetical protein